MEKAAAVAPVKTTTSVTATALGASTEQLPPPLAERVPFAVICRLFRQIKNAPRKKVEQLSAFIARWREQATPDATRDSFYPVMRLLLPVLDIHRSAYRLKEAKLCKLYMDYLGLSPDRGDGIKLIKYKERDIVGANAGDLSLVFRDVLENRCFLDSSARLSVKDVNALLDQLAEAGAMRDTDEDNGTSPATPKSTAAVASPFHVKPGSAADKRLSVIQQIVRRGNQEENFWFIRIVLKDLKIGLKEESVWKAFHAQASEFWGRCTDLKKLCHSLHNPGKQPLERVRVGQACGVMLAQDTLKKKSIVSALKNIPLFCLEVKFDGERIHLHKEGNSYHYFSRNRFEFKRAYDSHVKDFSHPKNIGPLFHKSVRNCILDGEMVGFDRKSKTIVLKGEKFDVKALGSTGPTRDAYPDTIQCYIVFDIVFLNDNPVYMRPLRERKELLREILLPDNERIVLADYQLGRTSEDFLRFANKAIENREEGIMIKDWEGDYKLGKRDKTWLKWKPEYVDSLVDELDLLIVGGYYGEGSRRSGGISHFLLAVAEPPVNDGEHPTTFNSFCKIGTGYTLRELAHVQERLLPFWKEFRADPKNPSMWPNVRLAMPGFKERPDVWIDPNNSIIVQVKAAEITPTDKFASRFTLRFPRLSKIRFDKPWHECMRQSAVVPLYQSASGKLASRLLQDHHLQSTHNTRGRKIGNANAETSAGIGRGQARPYTIGTQFKTADLTNVEEKSSILGGMKMRVMAISKEIERIHSKPDLEVMIRENGGDVVQVSGEDVVLISDSLPVRVKSSLKNFDVDVLKTAWLLESCRLGMKLAYTPKYLLHASQQTLAELKEHVDPLGDPYEEHMAMDDFDEVMDRVLETATIVEANPTKIPKLTMPPSLPLPTTPTASTSRASATSTSSGLREERHRRKQKAKSPHMAMDTNHSLHLLEHMEMASVESEHLDRMQPLRLTVAFMDYDPVLKEAGTAESLERLRCDTLRLVELDILVLGGLVSSELNEKCTHVIINPNDTRRVRDFEDKFRGWAQAPKVVSSEWVRACLKEDREVDAREFMIKF